MLTLKGFTIISSIVILIILGAASNDPRFYLLSLFPFLYLVIALVTFMDNQPKIKVTREIQEEIFSEGTQIDVELKVMNEGSKRLERLILEDLLPDDSKIIKGTNKIVTSLEPFEIKCFRYSILIKKVGKYFVGPINLVVFNRFGISKDNLIFDNKQEIKISPQVQLLRKISFLPKHLKFWPGEIVAKKMGIGNEFYGVIEQEESTDIKRINWKAIARTGKIMKNAYHKEVGTEFVIIVDFRSINNIENINFNLLELEIKTTLLVAYRLLKDRFRIGILIIGDKLYRLSPSFGKKQFSKILSVALDAKSGNNLDIRLLRYYIPLIFPINMHLIVITPAIDDASILSIIDLVRQGYQLTVIIPSVLNLLNFESTQYDDVIRNYLKIERKTLISKLAKYCYVVDWNVNIPIDIELERNMEIWKRYRRAY
jgi:uncharacterized protein (DUF58 family)